jgi:hypothetical protein
MMYFYIFKTLNIQRLGGCEFILILPSQMVQRKPQQKMNCSPAAGSLPAGKAWNQKQDKLSIRDIVRPQETLTPFVS